MKKKKGWTTTKLIAIGALVVMKFFLWVLLGASIFFSTGNIFGAAFSLFLDSFFAVFVSLLIRQFGTLTIFNFLGFFISLPLPKIIPGVVNLLMTPVYGLSIDYLSLLLLRKNEKIFSFLSGLVYNFIRSLELIILYFSIGFTGIQTVPQVLVTPVGLIIITLIVSSIGGLSGYAGLMIYKKLSKTAVVKRIQQ